MKGVSLLRTSCFPGQVSLHFVLMTGSRWTDGPLDRCPAPRETWCTPGVSFIPRLTTWIIDGCQHEPEQSGPGSQRDWRISGKRDAGGRCIYYNVRLPPGPCISLYKAMAPDRHTRIIPIERKSFMPSRRARKMKMKRRAEIERLAMKRILYRSCLDITANLRYDTCIKFQSYRKVWIGFGNQPLNYKNISPWIRTTDKPGMS